jgi:hypothetical protein
MDQLWVVHIKKHKEQEEKEIYIELVWTSVLCHCEGPQATKQSCLSRSLSDKIASRFTLAMTDDKGRM